MFSQFKTSCNLIDTTPLNYIYDYSKLVNVIKNPHLCMKIPGSNWCVSNYLKNLDSDKHLVHLFHAVNCYEYDDIYLHFDYYYKNYYVESEHDIDEIYEEILILCDWIFSYCKSKENLEYIFKDFDQTDELTELIDNMNQLYIKN